MRERLAELVASAPRPTPQCAFTIDVEDWFQSSVDFDLPISERVVRNVETVLALLDDCDVKGTFFVQGLVAARFPKLLREILAEGHEIQSHGHTHRPLYGMSRAGLRQELELACKSVEDACGVKVTAFRAPDFSILSENLWALEILAELGFRVDSSIFPMRTGRYGIAGWPNYPKMVCLPNGGQILEAPVAVWQRGRFSLPMGGGGYIRLLPGFVVRHAIKRMLAQKQLVTLYCHPYEFNPHELKDAGPHISRRFVFTQGLRRASLGAASGPYYKPLSLAALMTCLKGGRDHEPCLPYDR